MPPKKVKTQAAIAPDVGGPRRSGRARAPVNMALLLAASGVAPDQTALVEDRTAGIEGEIEGESQDAVGQCDYSCMSGRE